MSLLLPRKKTLLRFLLLRSLPLTVTTDEASSEAQDLTLASFVPQKSFFITRISLNCPGFFHFSVKVYVRVELT